MWGISRPSNTHTHTHTCWAQESESEKKLCHYQPSSANFNKTAVIAMHKMLLIRMWIAVTVIESAGWCWFVGCENKSHFYCQSSI